MRGIGKGMEAPAFATNGSNAMAVALRAKRGALPLEHPNQGPAPGPAKVPSPTEAPI